MSVWIRPDIAEIVASLPGVHQEVINTAHKGARILRRNIAVDTGDMRRSVGVDIPNNKDAFFYIDDPGALGYNYGHHNNWADRRVPGSYVIQRTIEELG